MKLTATGCCREWNCKSIGNFTEEEAIKHDFQVATSGMGGPYKLGGYARFKLSLTLSCLTSFTAPKASSTDHHQRKVEQAYCIFMAVPWHNRAILIYVTCFSHLSRCKQGRRKCQGK